MEVREGFPWMGCEYSLGYETESSYTDMPTHRPSKDDSMGFYYKWSLANNIDKVIYGSSCISE